MNIGEIDASPVYSRVGGEDPHGRLHRDRFSGAGLAYDCNCLALVQVNVDTADRMDRSCRCTEGNIQILDFQDLLPARIFLLLCLYSLRYLHGTAVSEFFCHTASPPSYISFMVGSSASRRPSATRLKESIRSAITMMGGTI